MKKRLFSTFLNEFTKQFAIVLISIGIFIAIMQPFSGITGAVIDISTTISQIWFFVGLAIATIGMIILFIRKPHGEYYSVRPLDEIMQEYGEDEDTAFVIDSCGAINYKKDLGKLLNKYPNRVYIPKRVLNELDNDWIIQEKFRTYGKGAQIDPKYEPEKYKVLRRTARNFLEKTDKHQDYLVLRKIVGEDKVPAGMSNKDMEYYENLLERTVDKRLMKKRLSLTKENRLNEMKILYKPGKADLDVLTTALKNASNKRKTKILSGDTHIEEAVDLIIQRYPQLEPYLQVIDYRDYEESKMEKMKKDQAKDEEEDARSASIAH